MKRTVTRGTDERGGRDEKEIREEENHETKRERKKKTINFPEVGENGNKIR